MVVAKHEANRQNNLDKMMIDRDPLEEFLEKERHAMEQIESLEKRASSTSPRSSIEPVAISPILAMSPSNSSSSGLPINPISQRSSSSPRTSISRQESQVQK